MFEFLGQFVIFAIAFYFLVCFVMSNYHRQEARKNFKEGKDSPFLPDEVMLFSNLFNQKGRFHQKRHFQYLLGFVLPIISMFVIFIGVEGISYIIETIAEDQYTSKHK